MTITKIFSQVDDTRASFSAAGSMYLGMLLAALVVFVFLRDWRATLITAVAMPVSLIPTFAVMVLFGFSLNTITLLALTLVIGILVDDAIVEIETSKNGFTPAPGPMGRRSEGRPDRPGGRRHHFRHLRGVHAGVVHAGHPRPVLPGVRPHRLRGGAVLADRRPPADAAARSVFPSSRPSSPSRANRCHGSIRARSPGRSTTRSWPASSAA